MTAFYYCLFQSHGRQVLAEELGADSPFDLAPVDIVDRVLRAGYTPITEILQREPFPQWGSTAEVDRGGLRFLVSVSRDAEVIGVQEVRPEAYAEE